MLKTKRKKHKYINQINKHEPLYNMPIILGDILQEAVRQIVPGVKVGKILIQRDETSIEKLPKLFYKKFPKDIADCFVILVDPMMATSGLFQICLNSQYE